MSDQWNQDQQRNWSQAYTSLIEFGRSALTSSALLNGGAAAAIIAAATAGTSIIKLSSLFWPLLSFCLGAASALLALGLAYYSEFCLLQQNRGITVSKFYNKAEPWVRRGSMCFGVLSLLLFVGGIGSAFYILSQEQVCTPGYMGIGQIVSIH